MLQASGVKVMGMLGGAAKGSFTRLDLDEVTFEAYYVPLRNLVRERRLDGLDLDVEEPMTLAGVVRLIDRLRADFGKDFLITLAPVAAALLSNRPEHNLSGFDYEYLEVMRGKDIAWYNTQFYCGWGDLTSTRMYDGIVLRGFESRKVVVGMVTNGANGKGWVPFEILGEVLLNFKIRYGSNFGGVMGWEYFNSLPGDREAPWQWARYMTMNVRSDLVQSGNAEAAIAPKVEELKQLPVLVDGDGSEDAGLPAQFDYFSDGSLDE